MWAQEASVPVTGGEVKYLHSAEPSGPKPLLVVLSANASEAKPLLDQWQNVAPTIVPLFACGNDPGARALDAVVGDALKRMKSDASQVYLVGGGPAASDVFYAVSRIPDRWAAALAVDGNPSPAIQSNRLFAANTQHVPVLWVNPPAALQMVRDKLVASKFHVEPRSGMTDAQVLEWLSKQRRPDLPLTVDCETGSPAFARCYWIEMTKFDPRLRNDALATSRVPPGSGASLGIGPFGYDVTAEGPGALVTWLPDAYSGPLRKGDRITAVAGKPVGTGRDYALLMEEWNEEKTVAVSIERGKERHRLETRVNIPRREENITARVQAQFSPDQKELLLITRTVSELRVTLPAEWAPVNVAWNALDLKLPVGGCWVLSQDKAQQPRPCE
jgi:hypothetical protein